MGHRMMWLGGTMGFCREARAPARRVLMVWHLVLMEPMVMCRSRIRRRCGRQILPLRVGCGLVDWIQQDREARRRGTNISSLNRTRRAQILKGLIWAKRGL